MANINERIGIWLSSDGLSIACIYRTPFNTFKVTIDGTDMGYQYPTCNAAQFTLERMGYSPSGAY